MKLWVNGVVYRAIIQGEGAPVLLLHGFTGRAESWQAVQNALADSLCVIALDLLGHGETDGPAAASRYRIEQAAADIGALLDALGIQRTHLLGYSMGGRLALYTALTYPALFETLVLESASPGLHTEAERITRRASDHALADRIEREGIGAFVDEWERLPLFASQAHLPESLRAQVRAQRLRNNARGLADSLRGMGTGEQPSLWERLPQWDQPALLLSGAHDAKYTQIAHDMAAHLQNGQTHIIADAGHTIHLEQPGTFIAAVRAFLAAHK